MVEAGHKGQLKGEVKAIRVLRSRNDKIPPQAFSFCTEIRHALVENGVKIVGEAAWRLSTAANRPLARHSCQPIAWRLQQVSSATCSGGPRLQVLRHQGIRRVLLLNAGGAAHCPSNRLAPQAQLRPRAFQACTALRNINLDTSEPATVYPNRCLPDCCFLEAGIVALALPKNFNMTGSAACASCQQLQTVDLSQTDVLWAQPLLTARSCNNSAFPAI